MRVDPWRTLAHDGARRQEVRSICTGWVIDYRYASWGEWLTLIATVEAINDWNANGRPHATSPPT